MQDSEPLEEIRNISIPNDLTIEILTRLPVKFLLRFRCVSKSWLSLISSPHFIKIHLKRSSNNNNRDYMRHRLLFTNYYNFKNCSFRSDLNTPPITTAATNIDHPMRYNSYRMPLIVGSINGLVCIAIPPIFLWNPACRKCKKLPKFGSRTVHNSWSHSSTSYGFGYDKSNDDYKVVGISSVKFHPVDGSMNDEEVRVKVYSLNTDSWRRIEDFNGGYIDQLCHFANGKLHWSAYPRSMYPLGRHGYRRKVFSLDLSNERYGEVEQPDYEEGPFDWNLHVLEGFLSVLCYYRNGNGHVDLWIMKEYDVKESWTKVVVVPNFNDPRRGIFCVPVFLTNDGKILFKFGPFLAIYNPKNKYLTYPKITNLEAFLQVDVYVESLVLPNPLELNGIQRQMS